MQLYHIYMQWKASNALSTSQTHLRAGGKLHLPLKSHLCGESSFYETNINSMQS